MTSSDHELQSSTAGPMPLGIIAGGGGLPIMVADAASAAGRPVHIIGIKGEADKSIERFPHNWFALGQLGKLFDVLKRNNCREAVLIGSVSRPDISQIKFDMGAVKLIPRIVRMMTIGGDQSVLSEIISIFEQQGVTIRGAHEVAPGLVAGDQVLSVLPPDEQALEDIEIAFSVIHDLNQYDVGQAVVVARKHVLAIEAVEGTDAMLERCAGLRQWGSKGPVGVLVKCPKPGQDRRIDLPTIGPNTVELAHKAGLKGVAVAADETLIVERQRTVSIADEAGLFLCGMKVGKGQ